MFTYRIDEEVSLKLPEQKDAERVLELINRSRKSLQEWLGWVIHTNSLKDMISFIDKCRSDFAANKSLVTFIVYRNQIVGTISFNEIDRINQLAYIGYWLDSNYEGNGIMTRAVKGLMNYGFNELALNRIDIRAAVKNLKSRAIPERLGFRQEGVIRQAEKLQQGYVDHAVYGMLKEEWYKQLENKL